MFTINTETNLKLLGDRMPYLGHEIRYNQLFQCWSINYHDYGVHHEITFHDAIKEIDNYGPAIHEKNK